MNSKLKIIVLILITTVISSTISSIITDMSIKSNSSTINTSPTYLIDNTPHRTGILPSDDGEYHPDIEYVMRHAFVSSSRVVGNTYGYSDPDDTINAMRDFEYVKANIGYDTPTELSLTWDKFTADIKYIRENSNSPYYRDALEAYADAKGDAKKAVQIINELHPILLSPENHKSYQAFTIIEE